MNDAQWESWGLMIEVKNEGQSLSLNSHERHTSSVQDMGRNQEQGPAGPRRIECRVIDSRK